MFAALSDPPGREGLACLWRVGLCLGGEPCLAGTRGTLPRPAGDDSGRSATEVAEPARN